MKLRGIGTEHTNHSCHLGERRLLASCAVRQISAVRRRRTIFHAPAIAVANTDGSFT